MQGESRNFPCNSYSNSRCNILTSSPHRNQFPLYHSCVNSSIVSWNVCDPLRGVTDLEGFLLVWFFFLLHTHVSKAGLCRCHKEVITYTTFPIISLWHRKLELQRDRRSRFTGKCRDFKTFSIPEQITFKIKLCCRRELWKHWFVLIRARPLISLNWKSYFI